MLKQTETCNAGDEEESKIDNKNKTSLKQIAADRDGKNVSQDYCKTANNLDALKRCSIFPKIPNNSDIERFAIEGSNMIFHSLTFARSRGKC